MLQELLRLFMTNGKQSTYCPGTIFQVRNDHRRDGENLLQTLSFLISHKDRTQYLIQLHTAHRPVDIFQLSKAVRRRKERTIILEQSNTSTT